MKLPQKTLQDQKPGQSRSLLRDPAREKEVIINPALLQRKATAMPGKEVFRQLMRT
ncbi:hypothetical protein HY772_00905 [Candidatus Woesearchaeota archaeon]|nr:hypothetical protein [Candidatus Woesearchaeota archaeon]